MVTNQALVRKKDKYKDLPDELQAQWELDRAKKAENKRKRAAARLEAAADPFAKKKGGKLSNKDKKKLDDAVHETITRLDASQETLKEEYEEKQKELKGIAKYVFCAD